jgi:hypothetical protein
MNDPEASSSPEEIEKAYTPYIINRCFSYFPDTIFHAQEMNTRSYLDKRMQYDYMLYALRKRKRFAPWQKAENPEDLDIVKEYFGFSDVKAKEALRILQVKDIELIRETLNKGGLKKKKTRR